MQIDVVTTTQLSLTFHVQTITVFPFYSKYCQGMFTQLFTARCYAERGCSTVCRLSVCPSVWGMLKHSHMWSMVC